MKAKKDYKDMEKYRECKRRQSERYRKRTGAGVYEKRGYTYKEDMMILEQSVPDRELSKKLQRSVQAIQIRRCRLRKEI